MGFQRITITGWQQFRQIDLQFHARLTVLTGANGSGKTTILRFLARHFGWDFHQLRTPYDRSSGVRYLISLLRGLRADEITEIGTIQYDNGRKTVIRVPPREKDQQAVYNLTIDKPETVSGFFIPSHRPEFRYQRVDSLQLRARPWRQDAFNMVQGSIRSLYEGGGGPSTAYHMKEIIIALAIFGYGNQVVEADPVARQLYESFQTILKKLLPPELGFISLAVRDRSEVVLSTSTGDFLLDAVSGGVAALIELAWQVFMFSDPEENGYVVVIDEPETHLHAAMQRRLMPSLIEAFPNAQFVIATHSPLVVGSVRESHVYALRFKANESAEEGVEQSVYSDRLDLYDKSGSAEQVLREVLDVDVSMPLWAEDSLRIIIDRYLSEPMTADTARRLRGDMIESGLERWVPDALTNIVTTGESK